MRALLLALLLPACASPLRAADDDSAAREESRARIEEALKKAADGAAAAAGQKPAPSAPKLGAPHWNAPRSFGGARREGTPVETGRVFHDGRPADPVEGELLFVLSWWRMIPGFSFLRDAVVEVDGQTRRSGFTPANAHLWTCDLRGKEAPDPAECSAGDPRSGDWYRAAVAGVSNPGKPHRIVFRATAGSAREFVATALYDGHGSTVWSFGASGCTEVAEPGMVFHRRGRTIFRASASNEGHCPLADRPSPKTAWDGERFR